MDIPAKKKQAKDQKNLLRKTSSSEDESFHRLRKLFLKTEEMKQVSEHKDQEMQDQFQEINDRLSTSSGFLQQIKRSMENIKFSYQRDILDLEELSGQSREDMDRQIEELRLHIGKLQTQKPQEEKPKPQTYQEAFGGVLDSFEDIAEGRYSSRN